VLLPSPCSGLDSYTADKLLGTLRSVASGGRLVIASLHQPSRDSFLSLDHVILMGHGRLLHAGAPAGVGAWLAARGLLCPAGSSTPEHMLKVSAYCRGWGVLGVLEGRGKGGRHRPGAQAQGEGGQARCSWRRGVPLERGKRSGAAKQEGRWAPCRRGSCAGGQ
jgi:hypothetical protein